MSRPLRIQYPNAWYHVMNRGTGHKKIFNNNVHRLIFLEILDECHKMFNIKIYAYCLMDNHYHLLLSTPDANISRAMRHINGVYTQRYNRILKTDGPLFRGRYKAQLIEEDCYLLIVSRYIHLNPVKARLVDNPAAYKWSSYPAYLGLVKTPTWLSIKEITEQILTTTSLSHIKDYKDYVEDKNMEEINVFIKTKLTAPIIGSTTFKEKILSQVESSISNACAADIKRANDVPTIELIIKHICTFYRIDKTSLLETKRGTLNWPRLVFMYISRKYFGHTIFTIAQSLEVIYRSTVSAGIQKCHLRLLKQPSLINEINSIYQSIKNSI